jgi:hypothetical protein
MVSGVSGPWAAATCSTGRYVHMLAIAPTATMRRTHTQASSKFCSIYTQKGPLI